MGLLSFIKDAGQKLFGHKEVEDAAAAAAANDAAAQDKLQQMNTNAASAIASYIESQNLGVSGLNVSFDGTRGEVTVQGQAPSQEAAEKVALCCGNVSGVTSVNNLLAVADGGDAAQYHDVASGDTLSAIAKKYYGDANKYMAIFEANKPMLSSPDKIYPGQKLRIPSLNANA